MRALFALAMLAVCASAEARDTLRIGLQLEPPGLDPTASAAAVIGQVTFPTVYEGLIHLGPGGRVEPGLAEHWERIDDGWRFHLRPGVRFHDGSALDADAVKFALDRALAPGSPNPQKPLLDCIGRVEAEDAATVAVHLARPCASLLQTLGTSAAIIVSPASAAGNAAHPVGTGPFRFESWARGSAVTLARNPDYWGGAPKLGHVVFRTLGDPNAALDALMAGDIDAFPGFPAPESVARIAREPRFTVRIDPTEGKTIVALNHRRKPFGDVRVRRALAYAIDRQAIIDAAMFGYGQPIGSHMAPSDEGYVDLTGRYPHDPATARRLLAEAGYPNGFKATLTLPPLAYARRSGEVVAAELAEIGVTVDLVQTEWATWLAQVFGRHEFDMTIVAHVEPMDYGIYGRDDYYFGYASERLKALLAEAEAVPDEPARLAALGAIQRQIADDSVNLFLFDYPGIDVWTRDVDAIWYQTPVQIFDLAAAQFADPTPDEAAARAGGAGRIVLAALGLAGAAGAAALAWRAGFGRAVRGALGLIGTVLAASLVIFAAVQLAPGDPAQTLLGMNKDPAALAHLRAELGLDRSGSARYLAWLGGLLRGDFGTSWTYRVPVARLILERLEVSLPLALMALALSTLLALALGLAAVAWRGRWAGRLIGGIAGIGVAVPNFWLGIVLVGIFGVGLRWLDAGGFAGWQAGLGPALGSLVLPALALALPQAAILARVLEAALIEAAAQDFVRTARAKGLTRVQALVGHALLNALLPVLAVLGLQFSFLLAGGVLIENVFALPGIGRLMFEAILGRDLVVVESVALVLVLEVAAVSLVADLAAAAIDPRLRVAAR